MSIATAIDVLKTHDIPTQSPIQAIRYLQRDGFGEERTDLSQEVYESKIKEIINTPMVFKDQIQAKYAFLYIIQELVKAHNGITTITHLTDVVNEALKCQTKFIEENKYFWESLGKRDDGVVKIREDGTVKPKKGSSKPHAERLFAEHFVGAGTKEELRAERKAIIQIFISEVGLTEKGAPTYFANAKNKWKAGELTLKSEEL